MKIMADLHVRHDIALLTASPAYTLPNFVFVKRMARRVNFLGKTPSFDERKISVKNSNLIYFLVQGSFLTNKI